MSAISAVFTCVRKPCGILRLSAGLAACIALFYWLNGKRSAPEKDEEDETSSNKSAATNNNNTSKQNEVPDLVGSEWIEIASVKELYFYPLKSGRGKSINYCDFTDYGISYRSETTGIFSPIQMFLEDRMFLVYSGKTGKFQTGRNYAKLVLVSISAVDETRVRLEAKEMPSLVFRVPNATISTAVPKLPKQSSDDRFGTSQQSSDDRFGTSQQSSDEVECSMWWGEQLKCIDCGSAAAAWISKCLTGRDDSDLRIGSAIAKRRNILKGPWEKFTKVYTTLRNEDTGYFADLASYMLMNEASLGELNERLKRNVTSLQFRPNIVVSGCEAFAEDSWEWIKIGESVLLRNVKPCPRCAMTRVDPETAEVDPLEPLKTLRSFREQTDPRRVEVDGKAPTLGIYCGLYSEGPVKIGDRVFVRPFDNRTSS